MVEVHVEDTGYFTNHKPVVIDASIPLGFTHFEVRAPGVGWADAPRELICAATDRSVLYLGLSAAALRELFIVLQEHFDHGEPS